jgi:carbamoyl-phosphate synthase large subunit
LCFQLIVDPNLGAKVFEINARFGGGYPLADHAGGKFAKWLLAEVSGLQSDPNNDWRDGVEMMRYDSAIYRG